MKGLRFIASFACMAALVVAIAGCGPQRPAPGPAAVTSYKIGTTNTSIPLSFTGTVVAQNSVKIRARVTGYVVEKYVQGGERVHKGQALFKLDSRQYQANAASAEANVARANASLQNAERDLARYQSLAKEDAIAQQVVDKQASIAAQDRASYEAMQAAAQIAKDNLQDTVVYAPFDGVLEMDAVDLGTLVQAGQTALVTIDAVNPIAVQFSMSEAQYLDFVKNGGVANKTLELVLADGTKYPYTGSLSQAAKTLDSSTGQLQLKASFPNPENLLLPNMFATIVSPGDRINNAILIPTKAITHVLNKEFVYIIGPDNKVKQTAIVTAGTQGIFTIVKSGIEPGANIVVDGLTKIRDGATVAPKAVTLKDIEADK